MLISVGRCGVCSMAFVAKAVLDELFNDREALLLPASLSELCPSSSTVVRDVQEMVSTPSQSDLFSMLFPIFAGAGDDEIVLAAAPCAEPGGKGDVFMDKFEFKP